MKRFSSKQKDQFLSDCVKEIGARFLTGVIPKTPVGQYPKSSHKQGGTLRRGWKVGSVTKDGNITRIDIENNVKYAPYVEHGHRTRNHKSFVEGKHMMKITIEELKEEVPKILSAKLKEVLK